MAKWLSPHGFTGKVHSMDAKVGGGDRMSFTNLSNGQVRSFGGKSLEPACRGTDQRSRVSICNRGGAAVRATLCSDFATPSKHHAMNKFFTLALLSFAALAHTAGAADGPPSAHDLHAAECVAALDANTHDLAQQVKSGNEGSRTVLQERLVSGTAFVGDTYLHGNSDEQQARALANQAAEAQKRLPAAELALRQTACAAEGAKLYAASNGLQQAVVKRLAKKRMEKLLGG